MHFKKHHICAATIASLLFATAAFSAPTYTFQTPTGSTAGGQSVAAEATFTVSQGNLDVTVSNLESPISDAGQVLGDLVFSLSTSLSSPTISGSGTAATIDKSGAYTTSTLSNVGWGLGTTKSGNVIICDICPNNATFSTKPSATPTETIIPSESSYASANGSIDGNPGHNPFLIGPVTFTIADASISSLTTISNVAFSFSTKAGVEVDGVPTTTPEPVSMALTGTGLALVLAAMLRRRKANAERA